MKNLMLLGGMLARSVSHIRSSFAHGLRAKERARDNRKQLSAILKTTQRVTSPKPDQTPPVGLIHPAQPFPGQWGDQARPRTLS
jgi:hypothetical protein